MHPIGNIRSYQRRTVIITAWDPKEAFPGLCSNLWISATSLLDLMYWRLHTSHFYERSKPSYYSIWLPIGPCFDALLNHQVRRQGPHLAWRLTVRPHKKSIDSLASIHTNSSSCSVGCFLLLFYLEWVYGFDNLGLA